jgi:hypothetical protein
MANTILVKRSSTESDSPTTSELSSGEIAMNTNDGRLFIKQTQGATNTILTIQGQEFISLANATFDDVGGGKLITGLSGATIDDIGA